MPYTYHIFHEPTGQHYYGARWAKNSDPSDFWSTYFTSSREVKRLIVTYGVDSFVVRVRRVFRTGEEARRWEHKVLTRLQVAKRKDWINKTYGQPPVCTYSRVGQGLGRKLSESHKTSISRSLTGRTRVMTEEHIRKAAAARIGLTRSPQTKLKMSRSSRDSKVQYTFTRADISFNGGMSDWADMFGMNVKSAATVFCKGNTYRGWSRSS